MLLKNVVGVAGGFAIDHFLKGDGLTLTAALALGLAFALSRFAICAGRFIQLVNAASLPKSSSEIGGNNFENG